jgi:hypothetical protein
MYRQLHFSEEILRFPFFGVHRLLLKLLRLFINVVSIVDVKIVAHKSVHHVSGRMPIFSIFDGVVVSEVVWASRAIRVIKFTEVRSAWVLYFLVISTTVS